MGSLFGIGGPFAESEETELNANFPFVRHVLQETSFFFPGELLMLVILDKLVEVARHCWEIVEAGRVDSVLILARDDQRGCLLFGCHGVDVHASTWLHGCRFWLLVVFDFLRDAVAFDDFDVEVNVRMERDGLATDGSPGESTTVNIVGRAGQVSLVALTQFWNG